MLSASIRDIDGREVIVKEYTRGDLAFNAENLFNSNLCWVRAAKQLSFRLFLEKFRQIIFENDYDTGIRVFVVCTGFITSMIALLIRMSVFLVRLCCIRSSTITADEKKD